jgi:hypothetical protein
MADDEIITDRCPGCQLFLEGERAVVEDIVAGHRKSCKRYIHWWAKNKAAVASAV